VIEVGLIRPGPLVGKMVNPYLRRRAQREPVTYPHPSVEPVLKRTLGFPIFQEQLLRVAMVVGGFSGGEAEGLRRAMTHKRAHQKMAVFERRFSEGALKKGLSAQAAAECWSWFTGFAEYGFPESHAYSFAYWVYASAYLKAYYPAVFLTVLLNAQPMGFYSPATLVKDAQRHGVVVHPPEVNASGWQSRIEEGGAVRLGLRTVLGLGARAGERFEAERRRAPFSSVADLAERCGFRRSQLDQLAEAGAFLGLGLSRRQALWEARAAMGGGGPLLSATAQKQRLSREQPLREMAAPEATLADYRTLGLTTGPQLIALYRRQLERKRVVPAGELLSLPNRRWTRIAGLVITRQRPATAQGLLFITLEDETGQANAVVMPDVFERYRTEALGASLLLIEGPLQNVDGVATVKAARLEPFGRLEASPPSHDFR
jgi:error-prone DNA polymerase